MVNNTETKKLPKFAVFNGKVVPFSDAKISIMAPGLTFAAAVFEGLRAYWNPEEKQLYVFQRTPSSVDERGNKPTDPDWARDLKPGWQLARSLNFNAVVTGVPVEEDLVGDGWTSIFQHFKKFITLYLMAN